MSLAGLNSAFNALADHARRVAAARRAEPDAFLTFRRLRSKLEREFASTFEELSPDVRAAMREVVIEFQDLKESDFLSHPDVIHRRIDGLALPEPARATTEDMLRTASDQIGFAPTIGGELRVPSFGLRGFSRRKWAFLVTAACLIIAALLSAYLLTRGASEPEPDPNAASRSARQDTDEEGDNPEPQPKEGSDGPEIRARYRTAIRLQPRRLPPLDAAAFAGLDFAAQIEALEQHFSHQPQGIDLIERLLNRAADERASWRREARENALAEYLAREGNLAAYRSHEALLPSEVFASLGGEALPLGLTSYYLLLRLGLKPSGVVQGERGGQIRIVPALGEGELFLDGRAGLINPATLKLNELRDSLLEQLCAREIESLSPELDRLMLVADKVLAEPALVALRKRVLLRLAGAAPNLASLRREMAARLLAKLSPVDVDDADLKTLALLFTEGPPVAWLEASEARGLAFELATGLSNLEALAQARLAGGAGERGPLIDLLLRASQVTPQRIEVLAQQLSALGVEKAALRIAEFRAKTPQASPEAIDDYLRALVREDEDQLLLAVILEVLRAPERLARAEVYARQGLTIAITFKAWAEADELLALAEARWPEAPAFQRLAAEVAIGRGNYAAGVALLERYLKQWPEDVAAQARLAEFKDAR